MTIDPRHAVDLAKLGPRAERIAVSHLEGALASPMHSWALRAVFMARLETAGQTPRPSTDLILHRHV